MPARLLDTPSSDSDASSAATEDFWKQKQDDLRQIKSQINQRKRGLMQQPRKRTLLKPAQSFRNQQNGRKHLSTIFEPKVIDQTNYKNYLKKRFPRITGSAAYKTDSENRISPNNDLQEYLSEYAPVVKPRRQVIHVLQPKKTFHSLEAYVYFCENKKFAQDFVNAFINQHLDEESIPDVLIDVLSRPQGAAETQPKRMLSDQADDDTMLRRTRHFKSDLRALPPVGEAFDSNRPYSEAFLNRPAVHFSEEKNNKFRSASDLAFVKSKDPNYKPFEAQSVDAMQYFLREELPNIFYEIVKEAVNEESDKIMSKLDVSDILAPYITDEVVGELISEICRRSIKELAMEEMVKGYQFDILQELIDELVEEYGPSVARRAVGEDFLENLLDELIEPIIDQEGLSIAREVLTVYDNRLRRRDLKEIERTARTKPLESMLLSHLIDHVTSSDGFLVSSRTQHNFLDGTALDILLKQYRRIQDSRRLTLTCAPLREVHKDIFTEDALDLISDELLRQVDADLCDLDFDEVQDPNIKRYTLNADPIYAGLDDTAADLVSP